MHGTIDPPCTCSRTAVGSDWGAAMARRYLACRRRRSDMLTPGLFADPAWDMLLDLYAAGIEGTSVSVTSLCIASEVPSTTALRWITSLEARGLIRKHPDGRDGRRTFITISEDAAAAIESWLRATFTR